MEDSAYPDETTMFDLIHRTRARQMSDDEFDAALESSIDSIYAASVT